MAVNHIDKNNFKSEVMESDRTVLLDFWAPWCMLCRMVGPILEEIAKERSDIKVGKIMNRSVGAKPKEEILAMV